MLRFSHTILLGGALLGSSLFAAENQPWPAPVPGWVAPTAGEHPRLLFRKADVAKLKEKAQTPEGKAIIARLRFVLGNNGESLPTKLPTAKEGYPKVQQEGILELGFLTIGHPAGYGLLYQLTGDKKYADLGKQAFEILLTGVRDVDPRYSFIGPNGELRSGSSWGIAGLGYDLCYDGWDPEFRVKIAKAFLAAKNEQGDANLKKVTTKPKHAPEKNHFGGIISGALGAAAIMGDPGTEGEKILDEWMPKAFENTKKMLTGGFGDHGFHSEGHGASHVSSDTGFLPWLMAAKNACGKDFITPAPNAQWISLRWVMEVVPTPEGCQYPDRPIGYPSYGTEQFNRVNHWSHSGQFGSGFGCVDAKYLPAMLWTYQNFIEAAEVKGIWCKEDREEISKGWVPKGEKTYDVVRSVWKGVLAFVNWPVGVKPENPVNVLGHSVEDRAYGYYVFRNEWKDENDILVTAYLGYGPKSSYKPEAGPVYVWAFGKRLKFGKFLSKTPAIFKPTAKGGVVSTDTQTLAVDFSGACGSPALLALVGIDVPKNAENASITTVDVGSTKVTVMTLQTGGKGPEVKVDGAKILVGAQTLNWDGKTIAFEK